MKAFQRGRKKKGPEESSLQSQVILFPSEASEVSEQKIVSPCKESMAPASLKDEQDDVVQGGQDERQSLKDEDIEDKIRSVVLSNAERKELEVLRRLVKEYQKNEKARVEQQTQDAMQRFLRYDDDSSDEENSIDGGKGAKGIARTPYNSLSTAAAATADVSVEPSLPLVQWHQELQQLLSEKAEIETQLEQYKQENKSLRHQVYWLGKDSAVSPMVKSFNSIMSSFSAPTTVEEEKTPEEPSVFREVPLKDTPSRPRSEFTKSQSKNSIRPSRSVSKKREIAKKNDDDDMIWNSLSSILQLEEKKAKKAVLDVFCCGSIPNPEDLEEMAGFTVSNIMTTQKTN